MEKEYLPNKIEYYVQEQWKKNNTFEVTEDAKKEKYYCLPMLPYPSGKLHMGHVRNYTISDVISRHQRMLGKNVLQPMGWDAFGLPAEEAAIKNNIIPSSWTEKNIKYMKKQLQLLGFSYDWSREIKTCDPKYYKWEQWFFTKLYEKKLVYKKNSLVNWCAYDRTVLANEQVIDGCCWRCQGTVKTKKISQWFLKIRNYAESLYQDLNQLTDWPEKVKNMQKNWIGRIKGFEINLDIFNSDKKIKVFTNQLGLIMGATYIVISFSHKISKNLCKKNKKIKNFIKKNEVLSIEEIEKIKYNGINTKTFAIHPFIKTKKIPIWIGNFFMQEQGINSILCIPGHDENHWNFAVENNLKIKHVLLNYENYNSKKFYVSKEGILFNSKEFNGLNYKDGALKIKEKLNKRKILKQKINYKLQDWCISRQRYWGAPIPMAKLKNGKIISIPEKNLPVLPPEIEKDKNSLKQFITSDSKWINVSINNENAKRETDTFDTFMESSWYYARYTCPKFEEGMIDQKAAKYWLPVDQYIGGIEHATMHLMYFRFYHKLLRDFKLISFDEPVKSLLCQGMVLSEAFYKIKNSSEKNWISSSLVLKKRDKKGKIIKSWTKKGEKVFFAGMIKMSKSKNNGVEPEMMINKYGADTIRLFIMFSAPIESSLEWKESGVQGSYRFLKKLWMLIFNYINIKNTHLKMNFNCLNEKQIELRYQLHKTIFKVSDDIIRRKTFNTAIASIMKLVNFLTKLPIKTEQDKSVMKESLINIIKMLYPFTPHFCFFVWKYFSKNTFIDNEKWPEYNEKILIKNYNMIIVQINGKKRCVIKILNSLNQKEICSYIKKQNIMKKYLSNAHIKRIIYIPNKVINFIL